MKNVRLICLLIFDVANASDTTQLAEMSKDNVINHTSNQYHKKITTYDNNDYMNRINKITENNKNSMNNTSNIKSKHIKSNLTIIKIIDSNNPLNITNNDLNCALISLINSFGIQLLMHCTIDIKHYLQYKIFMMIITYYQLIC